MNCSTPRRPVPLVAREHLRDQADEQRLERVWARLEPRVQLAVAPRRRPRPNRPWLALSAAAVLGAVLGVGADRLLTNPRAARLTAPQPAAADHAGPVVFAAGASRQSYALPGGGAITVMPEGIVDTVAVDASGLTLRLVRGEATVHAMALDGSMRHTPVALLVGGAQVVAEGGELRVHRRGDVAELVLVGGHAEITAPDDETGVRRTELRPGESLTVPIRMRTAQLVRSRRVGLPPSPSATAEAEQELPAETLSDPPIVSWRQRCDQDDYMGALDLLRQQPGSGAAAISAASSAGDLVCISDAYRSRGGDRAVAASALERLVTDFPSSAHAGNALFQLARLYEQAGNLAKAQSYYERYRSLSPTGGLAEDALCQMVLAAARAGDREALVQRGSEYREQYPDGPCVEEVVRLMAQSAQPPDVRPGEPAGSGGTEGAETPGPYDDDSAGE